MNAHVKWKMDGKDCNQQNWLCEFAEFMKMWPKSFPVELNGETWWQTDCAGMPTVTLFDLTTADDAELMLYYLTLGQKRSEALTS